MFSHEKVCEELLLNFICYELCCGRLSPEVKYLLEKHMEECQSCRDRILGFQRMLRDPVFVRNFG